MGIIKMLPKKLGKAYEKNMLKAGIENPEKYLLFLLSASLVASLLVSLIVFFSFSKSIAAFITSFITVFVLLHLFFYFRVSLKAGSKIKEIETMFPDVIQLMSSNLRAGMTIDRAFMLSARPEFRFLNDEILRAGREISTGRDIASALSSMAERISSEKITNVISLIISGIKSGGNISTLLEQTASNMREKEFMEKRAASNVMMYVIFIFFAVAIGAPVLFGMSSVLVEIIIKLSSSMPSIQSIQASMPFTFSSINLSPQFIVYFSILFLIVTSIISSLLIGLVNKGDEKAGLKYLLPLLVLSILIFFAVRMLLLSFISQTFVIS